MTTDLATSTQSKAMTIAGYILTGLVGLFFLFDGVMKLFKPLPVVQGTVKLGYPEGSIVPIGIVLIICTVLYLIPRTMALGAVLLTGYLGGAVASNVRTEVAWFPICFAVLFGAIAWGALWLRDARVRAILPLFLNK